MFFSHLRRPADAARAEPTAQPVAPSLPTTDTPFYQHATYTLELALKAQAHALQDAAVALDRAADALRDTGHPKPAQSAHRAGGHTWDNVQCACHQCNTAKGSTVPGQLRLAV